MRIAFMERSAAMHMGQQVLRANRVKILCISVGDEDDLMASAHSFTIHPSLLTHEGSFCRCPAMVAHHTARQRARSASLPKFVKETLVRFAQIATPEGESEHSCSVSIS